MELILRDYQHNVINKARESLKKGNKRIIIQAEVGVGKTVVATAIMKSIVENNKRVLFLAPRRQLIYQTVETLKDYGLNCGVIMAGEMPFSQPRIQVGSFDTITSRIASGRMLNPDASVVIVDEAHMAVTPARIKLLNNYPLVLALTATPALANGKGLGFFYQDIVETQSFAEMVKQKHLVPFRYFIGNAPDLSNVPLDKDGDYKESALAIANDQPTLIGDIYKNWKRIASDRTTLIFAVNRKHAQHIANEFKSHGVSTDYIDGLTPPEERERIRLDVESGKTQVIVNIGVMIAGVNWPRISCIVMARQTRNICTWRQCLGRGSRLYPMKKDTICIYHGSNFEELGAMDDPIEWCLDDKTTVKERKEKAKKDQKEPKDITCKNPNCGYVFKSSRTCPKCGHEMIAKGKPIPVHQADLVEVVPAAKIKPVDKERFYAELLGYARNHKKSNSFALAVFHNKFGSWPYGKNSIEPVTPSPETLVYIKHTQIAYSRRRAA